MSTPLDIGEELKAATQSLLLDIAKEALKLHDTLEGRKFTNADDVQAFRNDIITLEGFARDLDTNARRCQRYYEQGGS